MGKEITVKELELARMPEPSVGALMQQVVSAGITPDTVSVMKDLIAMKNDLEEREARKDFARAFVQMQKEMPSVKAIKAVMDGDKVRYYFAPFEHIREEARPILTANGFAVSFDTKVEDSRLISFCTLTHEGGHSQTNQFACRYTKPPGTSDAQGDMSTKSYAMRGAFCDACGIVIDKDTDGDDVRGLGGKVTPQQAESLRKRVRDTESDEARFLKYAGADDFEDIDEARYSLLDSHLSKKEAENAKGF